MDDPNPLDQFKHLGPKSSDFTSVRMLDGNRAHRLGSRQSAHKLGDEVTEQHPGGMTVEWED